MTYVTRHNQLYMLFLEVFGMEKSEEWSPRLRHHVTTSRIISGSTLYWGGIFRFTLYLV